MKVNWDENVAGLPMLKVRDVLKATARGFSLERLDALIADDQVKVSEFVDALIAKGWAELDGRGQVVNTIAGNGVAQAKKLKPISRKKAEQLLAQVLDAVDEINRTEAYAYDVAKLAVFGSYLGDSGELGDLDIAYELAPRWTDENAEEVFARNMEAFPPKKRLDFFGHLTWHETVVMKKLAVSNRVSFEPLNTILTYGFPYQMLRG